MSFYFKGLPKKVLRPVTHKNINCSNCKYSFNQEGMLSCKLYKYILTNDTYYYADTGTCRKNENLCGPDAIHFKER